MLLLLRVDMLLRIIVCLVLVLLLWAKVRVPRLIRLLVPLMIALLLWLKRLALSCYLVYRMGMGMLLLPLLVRRRIPVGTLHLMSLYTVLLERVVMLGVVRLLGRRLLGPVLLVSGFTRCVYCIVANRTRRRRC